MGVNASVGCCLIIARLPQLWKTLTLFGQDHLLKRTEVAPNSNVYNGEWGMSIFPLKWFSWTWRIKITSTTTTWEVNGFIWKRAVFHLQTYSQPCREMMRFFFFHLRTPGGRELTILGTYEVLGIGLGALQMMSRWSCVLCGCLFPLTRKQKPKSMQHIY